MPWNCKVIFCKSQKLLGFRAGSSPRQKPILGLLNRWPFMEVCSEQILRFLKNDLHFFSCLTLVSKHLFFRCSSYGDFNPNQPGLFWRLSCPGGGGGGGGGCSSPPSDLGRGSRDRRETLHKGRVRCKLQDCIVRLFFIIIFYFIWINYANLCTHKKKKSYFHYKSLKLQDCKFLVGLHIFFLTSLAIVLWKFSILKLISYVFYCFMNFLCISLFFQPFVCYCFFAEICCSHFLKHYLAKIN